MVSTRSSGDFSLLSLLVLLPLPCLEAWTRSSTRFARSCCSSQNRSWSSLRLDLDMVLLLVVKGGGERRRKAGRKRE